MPNKRHRVQCLHCKTIIESVSRHDFKRCDCGDIMIDGGPERPRVLWGPGLAENAYRAIGDDEETAVNIRTREFGQNATKIEGECWVVALHNCDIVIVPTGRSEPECRRLVVRLADFLKIKE